MKKWKDYISMEVNFDILYKWVENIIPKYLIEHTRETRNITSLKTSINSYLKLHHIGNDKMTTIEKNTWITLRWEYAKIQKLFLCLKKLKYEAYKDIFKVILHQYLNIISGYHPFISKYITYNPIRNVYDNDILKMACRDNNIKIIRHMNCTIDNMVKYIELCLSETVGERHIKLPNIKTLSAILNDTQSGRKEYIINMGIIPGPVSIKGVSIWVDRIVAELTTISTVNPDTIHRLLMLLFKAQLYWEFERVYLASMVVIKLEHNINVTEIGYEYLRFLMDNPLYHSMTSKQLITKIYNSYPYILTYFREKYAHLLIEEYAGKAVASLCCILRIINNLNIKIDHNYLLRLMIKQLYLTMGVKRIEALKLFSSAKTCLMSDSDIYDLNFSNINTFDTMKILKNNSIVIPLVREECKIQYKIYPDNRSGLYFIKKGSYYNVIDLLQ